MVLGFLYHMTDCTDTIVVEDPADTVKLDWFQDMLVEAQLVDAIIVLSHMDLKVRSVLKRRGEVHSATHDSILTPCTRSLSFPRQGRQRLRPVERD